MPRESMNDYEINQAALKDWMDVLARLWDAVDKPIDAKRLQNYRHELKAVPIGLLEKAVSRCIRENIYNNIPSVGKVWEAVRRELGNPFDIDAAIETWIEFRWQACFYRFGATK